MVNFLNDDDDDDDDGDDDDDDDNDLMMMAVVSPHRSGGLLTSKNHIVAATWWRSDSTPFANVSAVSKALVRKPCHFLPPFFIFFLVSNSTFSFEAFYLFPFSFPFIIIILIILVTSFLARERAQRFLRPSTEQLQILLPRRHCPPPKHWLSTPSAIGCVEGRGGRFWARKPTRWGRVSCGAVVGGELLSSCFFVFFFFKKKK